MLELLLDNKEGSIWDISELVTDATWKTSRVGKPGSFDFSFIAADNIQINNGNIVRAKWDGVPIFYGYIFTIGSDQEEQIKVKCYDQIRYLSTNETYVFKNMTAAAIVKRIADDTGLKWGHVVDTKYRIPSMVEDNQKLIDIICKSFDHTVINTGNIYNFFDEFGALTVRDARDMRLNLVIGDKASMYGYSFEKSIDNETYNRFKLVQDNKQSGHRDVYAAEDSANIAKWGRLQYFQKVDDNMNEAQINKLLDQLQQIKNRETKKLKLEALGNPSVRAGSYINVRISDLGIDQYYLVDECSHRFSGEDYTISLDLKVI
ncbi:hypothetical protein M3201_13640 [Paenibacillus motobuensis]|uniref:XkdQ/YqbQ family protein n=1 Tax=Paenibacillus TaxID=44249 RepID=UPI00203D5807|nr:MULTISPECIES: hypothetical protein [Paenibacillus]MCM3040741.1 hypothetical protein [Paenibacillus lutimineralis]MCM3647845.1 hypothetical protein [Paenibacillus motobuensis]